MIDQREFVESAWLQSYVSQKESFQHTLKSFSKVAFKKEGREKEILNFLSVKGLHYKRKHSFDIYFNIKVKSNAEVTIKIYIKERKDFLRCKT